MGIARLLGGSTRRLLVQALSIKPHRAELSTTTRGRPGPQRSNLGGGRGGQHNKVEIMSVDQEKPMATNQKDNSSRKGNEQVNDNTATENSS